MYCAWTYCYCSQIGKKHWPWPTRGREKPQHRRSYPWKHGIHSWSHRLMQASFWRSLVLCNAQRRTSLSRLLLDLPGQVLNISMSGDPTASLLHCLAVVVLCWLHEEILFQSVPVLSYLLLCITIKSPDPSRWAFCSNEDLLLDPPVESLLQAEPRRTSAPAKLLTSMYDLEPYHSTIQTCRRQKYSTV